MRVQKTAKTALRAAEVMHNYLSFLTLELQVTKLILPGVVSQHILPNPASETSETEPISLIIAFKGGGQTVSHVACLQNATRARKYQCVKSRRRILQRDPIICDLQLAAWGGSFGEGGGRFARLLPVLMESSADRRNGLISHSYTDPPETLTPQRLCAVHASCMASRLRHPSTPYTHRWPRHIAHRGWDSVLALNLRTSRPGHAVSCYTRL